VGKSLFTQGLMVLLRAPVPLERVAAALGDRPVLGAIEGDGQEGWMGVRPTLVVALGEGEGKLAIDVVEAPWPDSLGSAEPESPLFNAWNMGFLGPFAAPGALARGVDHNPGQWEGARAAAGEHKAFVRVRSSWVIGAGEGARVVPEDYDAEAELEAVTKVAESLLALPEALAYWNPSGEVLLPRERVSEALALAFEHVVPPFDLWANVRLFREGEWTVMDSVGMAQLDMDDQEVCFASGKYDPQEVYGFIRQATFFMLEKGMAQVSGGEVSTGPGGVAWRGQRVEQSLAVPPRPAMRWFPVDGSTPPAKLKGE
jgi:hypothetical protein